jgi:hypothetical protein
VLAISSPAARVPRQVLTCIDYVLSCRAQGHRGARDRHQLRARRVREPAAPRRRVACSRHAAACSRHDAAFTLYYAMRSYPAAVRSHCTAARSRLTPRAHATTPRAHAASPRGARRARAGLARRRRPPRGARARPAVRAAAVVVPVVPVNKRPRRAFSEHAGSVICASRLPTKECLWRSVDPRDSLLLLAVSAAAGSLTAAARFALTHPAGAAGAAARS